MREGENIEESEKEGVDEVERGKSDDDMEIMNVVLGLPSEK